MHDFLDSVPEWTGISVVLGYVNFKISVTDTTQASLITENQYAPIVSSVLGRCLWKWLGGAVGVRLLE